MKKFVLFTSSESGDHYTYFIKHKYTPTNDDLYRFLEVYANDKNEEEVFESINSIHELKKKEFIYIPGEI